MVLQTPQTPTTSSFSGKSLNSKYQLPIMLVWQGIQNMKTRVSIDDDGFITRSHRNAIVNYF